MCALLAVLACPLLARAEYDIAECPNKMQTWIDQQNVRFPPNREVDATKLLYFLHVPRTAGRTTHNCFLMPMLAPSRRCAKSYDGNKYNISVPDCGLLSSHDDYSAMYEFPSHTAVYTSIRNPVGRFLSAYEFAVEIASREAVKVLSRKGPSAAAGRVSTKNVWPWSYLAPFVEDDMVQRVRPCPTHSISVYMLDSVPASGCVSRLWCQLETAERDLQAAGCCMPVMSQHQRSLLGCTYHHSPCSCGV